MGPFLRSTGYAKTKKKSIDHFVIVVCWSRGHTDAVLCLQFDHYKVVSGSKDKTIKVHVIHVQGVFVVCHVCCVYDVVCVWCCVCFSLLCVYLCVLCGCMCGVHVISAQHYNFIVSLFKH